MKITSWSAVVGQPDQLGESPFWHPEERRLYWVDIPARQIRKDNVDEFWTELKARLGTAK